MNNSSRFAGRCYVLLSGCASRNSGTGFQNFVKCQDHVNKRSVSSATKATQQDFDKIPRDKVYRPSTGVEKEWFQENAAMAQKIKDVQQKKKLHFVFLEGPAGSGKSDILWRLQKVGYTTAYHSFADLFKVMPCNALHFVD